MSSFLAPTRVPPVPQTPEACFAAALARDPGRPLVTFYDTVTGERIELSAKSMANWVAKTHHMIVDTLGLGVGDSAFVDLPLHWMAAPVLLGCWSAGLRIVAHIADADCAFVAGDAIGAAVAAKAPEIFALSLAPMGRPFDPVPERTEDFVLSVRPMPDAWASVHSPASPSDPAWADQSRQQLVSAARDRAAAIGLAPGGRLLAARSWGSPASAGWLDALLVPLAIGASMVLVRTTPDDPRAAEDSLIRIAAAERSTVTLA
jgi:uncharacterized protein (TIGR03089 family)